MMAKLTPWPLGFHGRIITDGWICFARFMMEFNIIAERMALNQQTPYPTPHEAV